MSKYLLPKPHLSWSAMTLWESSPDRFKREYFEGARRLDTKYLQFGKGIAQLVEDLCEAEKSMGSKESALEWLKGEHGLDDPTVEALGKLDTEGISEHQMKATVREVPLLSYIDKYRPVTNDFREYKTGKHPWDRAKVYKHGQLVFYAVMLRATTGEMPAECWLDWLETRDGSVEKESFWQDDRKRVFLTGKVQSYHRIFDIRELEKMEERIERAAVEIDSAYREFISTI